MSGMGPGGSMGATAELEATQTAQDEDEVMHQYQNQETIELHTIDAHQVRHSRNDFDIVLRQFYT